MLVLVLLSTTLIFLMISYLIKWRKFLIMASKIPSPKNHIPLIGVMPKLLGKDLHGLFEIYLKEEKAWRLENKNKLGKLWFGPEILVLINTPDRIQKVLNAKECLDKPKFFKFFGIEQASLFGTLDAWRRHRKILNPAFSMQILKTFVPVFDQKSRKLVKSFEELCGKSEFDIFPQMSAFFLETILNAALDLNVDILGHKDKDKFVKHFDDYYSAITARISKFWLHFEPFYKMTKYYAMEMDGRTKGSLKFADEIFENAKRNLELQNNNEDEKIHANAIKTLVDPKYQLSDEEIKQEIITLLVAAQDSTTIIISTALLMLAMHKNVQAKVVDELHNVFASVDDEVDFDALNKLPYLEMVIKETLRLFPISAFTLRTSTDDFELEGYKIPAGANFILSVFTIHRNTTVWGEDAGAFNPERFEAERIKNIHPYAYVPFSGGARYCIGSKYAMLFMKTCLSNFLRNYEVDTTLKYDELKFRVSVTLKILQETKISLKVRNFSKIND